MANQRVYFEIEVMADLHQTEDDEGVRHIEIGGKVYKLEGELKKFLEDQAFYYADPNGWE